ncbi:hypothetical protein GCM10009676_32120 [Prauserella halophila]|uniref:Mce-associated membrane protein n=1 Tax=Prauserella halophila TaxID=185641 RepID=A0ABN1WHU6_9PSEU|nr:hypothetical protein [Prauserella halophila]MCP2238613.1 Mce-associated membrane protein [Prauserella halophila]
MSSNRRKPSPQPRPTPSRRPKVAGLRKPGSTEDVEATETGETGETAGAAETVEAAESAEGAGTARSGRARAEADSEPEDETGTAGDRDTDDADDTDDTDDTDDRDTDDADAGSAGAAKPAPSPGPRRKAKDGGRAKPANLDEAETLEADEPGAPAATAVRKLGTRSTSRRRPGFAAVAVLLVAGLLLAGAAVFFQIKGSEARAATSNTALVDGPATAEVKEAMEKAAERLFSIDHNNLGKTEEAAEELLAGGEVEQKYDALMGEIKRLAPEQKIVVTVHAARSAVVNLDGDRARVMVLIDQAATRPSDDQPAVGGAAMWLETEKRDGEWKVTNLDTYAAQQAAPTPGQSQDPSGAPLPGDGQGSQDGNQNGDQQGDQDGGENGGENGGQQDGQQGGENGGEQGGN